MRTVTVYVKVRLIVKADDDIHFSEIMNEMEYDFTDTTTKATIEDCDIMDYEVIDSR